MNSIRSNSPQYKETTEQIFQLHSEIQKINNSHGDYLIVLPNRTFKKVSKGENLINFH